jgi:CheY-like chemotaxis protein
MSHTVLLVEDESKISDTFKKQLDLIGGFKVTIVENGQEAIDILNKNDYDIILLDLVMPEMDGLAFLERLRDEEAMGEKAKLPVIAFTNVTSDRVKEKAEKLGIKDYIVKTDIEPQELISKINSVIEGSKS